MANPSSPFQSPSARTAEGTSAAGAVIRAGVPVSVWPSVPVPGACPASPGRVPCPRRYTAEAAAAVITALSRPGELVAVPLPDDAVLAAAAAAHRVTCASGTCSRHARRSAPGRDPGLRPGCQAAMCGHGGRAALAVVTACPGCGHSAVGSGGSDGPDLPYGAFRRLLRPGGLLAIITAEARHPGHAGQVIARARAAGLAYTQHVIAVHAPVTGDRLTSPWPQQEAHGHEPVPDHDPVHVPVHTDLLLFTRRQGACR